MTQIVPHVQRDLVLNHGHILVDGKKVSVASYQVKVGAQIALKEKTRRNAEINRALEAARSRGVPEWLELDAEAFQGRVLTDPKREEIKMPLQEHLIVELDSK